MTEQYAQVTAADAGCWAEGSRGRYAASHVIDVAASYGFPMSDDDRAIVEAYDDDADEVTLASGETLDAVSIAECVTGQAELCDKAADWLNEHIAPEGYSFGWHDGEFFLWSADDWAEDYI